MDPSELPPIPARTLYLSLSGTDRTEWQRSLALIAGGIFAGGLLIGVGIAKLGERKNAEPGRDRHGRT